jgi:hypothetical protein
MSSVLQLQENRVKLNVGGVKFVTSLDTLLMHPDSMLGSMFSGKYRLEKVLTTPSPLSPPAIIAAPWPKWSSPSSSSPPSPPSPSPPPRAG